MKDDRADPIPFHVHLDVCARCRNQPFNLCETGALMLRVSVALAPMLRDARANRPKPEIDE
jgi:hypothetical protein